MEAVEADFCVVGAGFAGLTAAVRLQQAGASVAVLEARDRVGGRTWTVTLDDGTWVDRGGAWVGPTQDRLLALIDEFGASTYKQHVDGESIMVIDGKQHRYKGTVPMNLSPFALANLGLALKFLDAEAKKLDPEAPWDHPKAEEYDEESMASWLGRLTHVPNRKARDVLSTMTSGFFTCHPSEVSLLSMLLQLSGAGGVQFQVGVEGGAEDQRVVGGMGAVSAPMAASLGDSLHLGQPVRTIRQNADGVEVVSDGLRVRAKRVVVTLPLAIANTIDYGDDLPSDRYQLMQRAPLGAVYKIAVVYDEPFWRADGLSGETVATNSPLPMTIDCCTDTPTVGLLNTFPAGPDARRLALLSDTDRKQVVIDELVERFGPKAASPIGYIEQNWTTEKYTGGGMISHYPPGVLTQYGRSLRPACGRIHWAGTETSGVMHGFIDGAVRSGERAAREAVALG